MKNFLNSLVEKIVVGYKNFYTACCSYPIFAAVMLLLVINTTTSTGIIIHVLTTQTYQAPLHGAFIYTTEGKAILSNSEFCPGDIMKIVYNVDIVRAPVIVDVYETFWSVDLNQPIQSREHTLQSTIYTKTGVITKSADVLIPDFPSGSYEYRRASAETYSTPHVLTIPFSIKEECPSGGS